MAAAADNLALLKAAYTKWNESKGTNEQVWFDAMADTVHLKSLAAGKPGAEFTRDVRGKDDLRRYFQGLREGWKMKHYSPKHFVVEGDRIAVMGTTCWTARATGRDIDTPKADFVRFENGKIVEFYEFYDTAALGEAAQSG